MTVTGCSLMEPQPELIIPTPPAELPTPALLISNDAGELITDPVSDVVPTVDPAIESLILEVSQQQLMAYIRQLESFGTRNAFSDTQSETFGIGAARRWIFNEFVRVGNGRLTVEFQDFPLSYNGYSAEQSNVVATLPGTGDNPGVLIMVANYDTAREDVLDGESPNPGADDNGSGVAALLKWPD